MANLQIRINRIVNGMHDAKPTSPEFVVVGKRLIKKDQPAKQNLMMVVDVDERGAFMAHVNNDKGEEVFSFSNLDSHSGELWLVEDGYMRHARDGAGLLDYLQSIDLVGRGSALTITG